MSQGNTHAQERTLADRQRTDTRAAGPLLILAFDHRSVLQAIYAHLRPAGLSQGEMEECKDIVVDALLDATDQVVASGARPGLLIDERTGARNVQRAHDRGVVITMPIEVSGAALFTLEFGDAYLEHLKAFPVDYAKALVFLNPGLRGAAYEGQIADLAAVFGPIADAGYQSMLEILVPATEDQLTAAGGDRLLFDEQIRPQLVAETIEDCYAAGLRPTLWKLEGLDSAASYELVSGVVRHHDPAAHSLVLGRGAATDRVHHWLRLAAVDDGFGGFAIGRSIWEDALGGWLDGAVDRARTTEIIAQEYAAFARVYCEANGPGNG